MNKAFNESVSSILILQDRYGLAILSYPGMIYIFRVPNPHVVLSPSAPCSARHPGQLLLCCEVLYVHLQSRSDLPTPHPARPNQTADPAPPAGHLRLVRFPPAPLRHSRQDLRHRLCRWDDLRRRPAAGAPGRVRLSPGRAFQLRVHLPHPLAPRDPRRADRVTSPRPTLPRLCWWRPRRAAGRVCRSTRLSYPAPALPSTLPNRA